MVLLVLEVLFGLVIKGGLILWGLIWKGLNGEPIQSERNGGGLISEVSH